MRPVTLNDGNVLTVYDAGEALSDRIFTEEDYYEREILDYIEKHYKKHDVILDVGANIGNHTLFFATHLDYNQIWALEPIPQNFDLLQHNVENLGGVRTRRVAVGDGNLDIKMSLSPDNMGACEVTPIGDIPVHQIRVDDLLVQPVTLLKIDVEWYEPFVLLGAKNIIESDKPLILIEDTEKEYGSLLPDDYHLIMSWPEQNTYLYGVQ